MTMMKSRIVRTLLVAVTALSLGACKTTIVGSLSTTSSTSSTTTTVPVPSGDVKTLLGLLADVPVGLGQAVVDGDKAAYEHKVAQADAIWTALGPRLEAIDPDYAASVERVVKLVHTAVERKRPADGDKALRFIDLIVDAENAG